MFLSIPISKSSILATILSASFCRFVLPEYYYQQFYGYWPKDICNWAYGFAGSTYIFYPHQQNSFFRAFVLSEFCWFISFLLLIRQNNCAPIYLP